MITKKMMLPNKCCACEYLIDIDIDDYGWSQTKEDYLCLECSESDWSSLSMLTVIVDGEIKKFRIGKHIRMTNDGDDMQEKSLTVEREWVKTDDWRGYFNTKLLGWTEIMSGWTTSNWGDDISDKKQIFNQWAQEICVGEIIPPVTVAIVVDPTSNLFSSGISVLTTEPDKFKEWIELEFVDLQNSLS